MSAEINIGTCAWSFDDWRGAFYPKDLPPGERLEFYARHLSAVEIDSTFYHVPELRVVKNWAAHTPPHFRFTCKLPKAITHEAKLRDCEDELTYFLDSMAPLGDRLGCVLIQLPPSFAIEHDEDALKHFVMGLPRSVPFAVEFRHTGWHLPRVIHFLEQNEVAWVWADVSPLPEQNRAPFEFLPQTSSVIYIRLLGDVGTKYHTDGSKLHNYGTLLWPREEALESWAVKIQKHLDETCHLFVMANNHFEGFAPVTCQRLGRLLGIDLTLPVPEIDPVRLDPQMKLL